MAASTRPGAVAFAVGLASLCLGLSFGSEWGWTSARTLGVLAAAVSGLAAAMVVELHRPDPLLDVRLVGSRLLGSALLSFMLSILALFAVSFLLPFYTGLGGTAAETAALQAQFLHAMHSAVVVLGALAALGILTALVRGSAAR